MSFYGIGKTEASPAAQLMPTAHEHGDTESLNCHQPKSTLSLSLLRVPITDKSCLILAWIPLPKIDPPIPVSKLNSSMLPKSCSFPLFLGIASTQLVGGRSGCPWIYGRLARIKMQSHCPAGFPSWKAQNFPPPTFLKWQLILMLPRRSLSSREFRGKAG